MKSWAHTYMAGSVVGTILIVAALVAFVPLVSLEAPGLWPTPGLGLGGGGDAGVSRAVAVGGTHPGTAGLDSNPSVGPSVSAGTAVGVASAQGPKLHNGNGQPGGAGTVASPEAVAVAPASAEVVARHPGAPAPESAAAPPPPANPTEAGGAPVVATTGGEVAGLGETPPAPPIVAGVGGEEAESSLPPEGDNSQPPEEVGATPPPSGGSTEGGDSPGSPGQDDEGEEMRSENGDVPEGSALDFDPGAGGSAFGPAF